MPFGDLLPFLEPTVPCWMLSLQPHACWKYNVCWEIGHAMEDAQTAAAGPACMQRWGTRCWGSLFHELLKGLNSSSLAYVVICSTQCQFWDTAQGPDGIGTLGVILLVGMRVLLLVESGSYASTVLRAERCRSQRDGACSSKHCAQEGDHGWSSLCSCSACKEEAAGCKAFIFLCPLVLLFLLQIAAGGDMCKMGLSWPSARGLSILPTLLEGMK